MLAIKNKNNNKFVGIYDNRLVDLENAKTYRSVAAGERALKNYIFRHNQKSELKVEREDFNFVRVKLVIDN